MEGKVHCQQHHRILAASVDVGQEKAYDGDLVDDVWAVIASRLKLRAIMALQLTCKSLLRYFTLPSGYFAGNKHYLLITRNNTPSRRDRPVPGKQDEISKKYECNITRDGITLEHFHDSVSIEGMREHRFVGDVTKSLMLTIVDSYLEMRAVYRLLRQKKHSHRMVFDSKAGQLFENVENYCAKSLALSPYYQYKVIDEQRMREFIAVVEKEKRIKLRIDLSAQTKIVKFEQVLIPKKKTYNLNSRSPKNI